MLKNVNIVGVKFLNTDKGWMKHMSFAEILKRQFGDNVLSLSGEVLITSKMLTDCDQIQEYDVSDIEKMLEIIRNKYSFLKAKVDKSLFEINVSFFCHNVRGIQEDFLDGFREELCVMVSSILGNDKLCVNVNVFGKFETIDLIKEYRYLNKLDDVRYKIMSETYKDMNAKLMRPKVYLIVLLIIVCGCFGYCGYQQFVVSKDSQKIEQKIDDKSDKKSDMETLKKPVNPRGEAKMYPDGKTENKI